MSTVKQTPFYQAHLEAGAKLVDFSGWCLPIHYGSQIKEHEAVRTDAGMFDVSHMLITDVKGSGAKAWLQKLLANDVERLAKVGKALYSPMLNDQGGVIDDLIVYRMNEAEDEYRIVSNAATREKDFAHFQQVANDFSVELILRSDLAMLAIQGPQAIAKLIQVKPDWANILQNLSVFQGQSPEPNWFVARTGYTGEDGVEIMLTSAEAAVLFHQLKAVGVLPCGLGARDTLRLEAGMNLYGHDMDEQVSPWEAGLGWTVALDNQRDFIGRNALLEQKKHGLNYKQVGLLLQGRGVLRDGMEVITVNGKKGVITSGSFSPSLKQSIAIARVPVEIGSSAKVIMRGEQIDVQVVKLPFVRQGQVQFNQPD